MNNRIETVVLDSQGLSAWIAQDRRTLALIRLFHSMGADLVVCASTLVEVAPAQAPADRLDWVLSQVRVEPVSERAARGSAALLEQAGLHGRGHAANATVAELALRQPGPVALLASDVDDLARLCGGRVLLIAV